MTLNEEQNLFHLTLTPEEAVLLHGSYLIAVSMRVSDSLTAVTTFFDLRSLALNPAYAEAQEHLDQKIILMTQWAGQLEHGRTK